MIINYLQIFRLIIPLVLFVCSCSPKARNDNNQIQCDLVTCDTITTYTFYQVTGKDTLIQDLTYNDTLFVSNRSTVIFFKNWRCQSCKGIQTIRVYDKLNIPIDTISIFHNGDAYSEKINVQKWINWEGYGGKIFYVKLYDKISEIINQYDSLIFYEFSKTDEFRDYNIKSDSEYYYQFLPYKKVSNGNYQPVNLSINQIKSVLSLLNSEPDPSAITADCYHPHHAILFFRKGKVQAFYEFCLECGGHHQSENLNFPDFSLGKAEAMSTIMKEIGSFFYYPLKSEY